MCERFIRFCHEKNTRMWHVMFFFLGLLVIGLYVSANSFHCLELFSQPPLAVEGNITSVQEVNGGYYVYVDRIPYHVKAVATAEPTYGIRKDVDLKSFGNMLRGKLGYWARVEYIPLAGQGNPVLRLSVSNAGEYVDPEAALRDHIADETLWLKVYGGLSAACILGFCFALKCFFVERTMAQDE